MDKITPLVEYVKANRAKAAVVAAALASALMVAANHTVAFKVGEYLLKAAVYLQTP
jgi:hypothetical protein